MRKRRKKSLNGLTSNINNITVDINYEKLADAIITAQQKINKQPEELPKIKGENIGIVNAISGILQNKKDTSDRMTMGFMAIPIMILFKVMSSLGFAIVAVGIYAGVMQAISMTWIGVSIAINIGVLLLISVLILIMFLYSVIMWGAANEMEKTEDKYFVAAVFSGMVSLIALVVSFIALKS